MREVETLRPLTALRLLTIWRESREAAEDPLERALLSNAAVLAECCFSQGEAVFADADAVLQQLTPREMEELLGRLAEQGTPADENPAFDRKRFEQLLEG